MIWEPVWNATSYIITRTDLNPPQSHSVDVALYDDTTGPYGVFHTYHIQSVGAGGTSQPTGDIKGYFQEAPVVSSVNATDNAGSPITISWSQTTLTQWACKYQLFRREVPGQGPDELKQDNITPTNQTIMSTTYDETVLGNHQYGIRAINGAGTGPIAWDIGSTAPAPFTASNLYFEYLANFTKCARVDVSGGSQPYTASWQWRMCPAGTCGEWIPLFSGTVEGGYSHYCRGSWPTEFEIECTVSDNGGATAVRSSGVICCGSPASLVLPGEDLIGTARAPEITGAWQDGSGALVLSLAGSGSGPMDLALLDLAGRRIASERYVQARAGTARWKISDARTGIYWIVLKGPSGQSTRQVFLRTNR